MAYSNWTTRILSPDTHQFAQPFDQMRFELDVCDNSIRFLRVGDSRLAGRVARLATLGLAHDPPIRSVPTCVTSVMILR